MNKQQKRGGPRAVEGQPEPRDAARGAAHRHREVLARDSDGPRKGTNGVSTNEVSGTFMFFDRYLFQWVKICQHMS